MNSEATLLWIIFSASVRESIAGDGNADQKCTDNLNRKVASGERFFPPARRPCTECLCVRGASILCNFASCIDHVNCTNPKWSGTVCCNSDCITQKRMMFADLRQSNYTPDHPPYNPSARFDYNGQRTSFYDPSGTGSIFGMDDAGYIPTMSFDNVYNVDQSGDGNSSLNGGVPRAQNLPSPYYPILIGLISCAPVALCIICINALRKYFALRSQCSHGGFFPARRRNQRGRPTLGGSSDPPAPVAYLEPPPAYKDLESPKFKLSEDLPKYEDVLKHDQQVNHGAIFATSSSARFQPPERITFTYLPSTASASAAFTTTSSAAGNPENVPDSSPPSSSTTISPPKTAKEGIDNPAHEPDSP